jgi:hypothetical protein
MARVFQPGVGTTTGLSAPAMYPPEQGMAFWRFTAALVACMSTFSRNR